MDSRRPADASGEATSPAVTPHPGGPSPAGARRTEGRDGRYARADGLSADDAYALAVWLKENAHADIEIIPTDPQRYSVRWRR
jgi:hypothetical protein